MLSEDVDLPLDEATPLPWYPPYCPPYKDKLEQKYENLSSLKKWEEVMSKRQEDDINLEYTKYSPEKNYHEWGARVSEAIKRDLSPKWVIFLLAGAYWRLWGHPQNGIHCHK